MEPRSGQAEGASINTLVEGLDVKRLFQFLIALACGGVGAAEKVCMPFFELINVHSDYQYSTARLFKSYVDEVGKYELVIPQRSEPLDQPPLSEVRSKALQEGCAYYLIGDMNRISESVIISVALYGTEDGKRIWSDKLKAANPGDLDPIFQRLARALGTRNKAAHDEDIYSVTSFDQRNPRKVNVTNSFGLAIGGAVFTPGLLVGDPWNDPFAAGFGIVWAYDARTVLFEVDAQGYALGRNSALGMIGMSAFKPIGMNKVAPFFGGGLGLGFAETRYAGEKSQGSGLMAHVGAGVILNRTSTVQLRLQTRYVIGLYSMEEPRGGMPRAVLMRMELGFGK